jgi:diacylglycerol kinase family enzyme
MKKLSDELDVKSNRIIALAGGGDGTVNWLLTELIRDNIDFERVIFGAFPLGTGNDFAKNLGWKEYNLFDNNFAELHNFVA